MKTSISSDVWEKKKALIAKLYMEEEWPLKQVIKQIRSDDFNPSETQLRSRLKKWRVTKPSRQTRKRTSGTDDGDSDKDVKGSSSSSPRNQRPPPMKRDSSTISPHWTGAYRSTFIPSGIHATDNQQLKWNASLDQQVSPTPSGEHGLVAERPSIHAYDLSPTTTTFEQSAQTSPINDGLMVNTSSELTPTYAGYPLSPDSCIPSPGSTTAMPWPARSVSVDVGLNASLYPTQWYPMPFEPITPPSGVPHSAQMAPPGYRDHMPMVVPSNPGVFPHEYGSFPGDGMEYPHGYDPKHWKRTMSLQYDFAGHPSARPDQADRKHMPVLGHLPPGMVPMPAGQSGPHNGMCAPTVPYLGQNPMVHKQHHGVGY